MNLLSSPDRSDFFFAGLTAVALVSLCISLPVDSFAQSRIELSRDEEKTVYSIGSDKQAMHEDSADKDKAWQMLKNMGTVVDQRKRNLPQSDPTGSPQTPPSTATPSTANER